MSPYLYPFSIEYSILIGMEAIIICDQTNHFITSFSTTHITNQVEVVDKIPNYYYYPTLMMIEGPVCWG